LGYGCASVSIISPYLTSINRLFTNTYERDNGTENPCIGGSSPPLPILLNCLLYNTLGIFSIVGIFLLSPQKQANVSTTSHY